jgi:hypothetical protein
MTDLHSFKLDSQFIDFDDIFLLSDTHFGVRSNSVEWLDNQKSYFYDFYIPFLKSNKKEKSSLFILGDWFDNRQTLDINVMNASIDIILELASIMPIYFIIGNHDIYRKFDTDVNSLIAFKFIPNVYLFEKPTIITNRTSSILILPWLNSKEDHENYVRSNKFDYIFTHADISGFKYDNGRDISSEGVDFRKFTSVKRIFSGHIHKRQEAENIIYLGSPYHTKRSDIGNKKGMYIFIPNKNEFTFKLNSFSPIFQRIHLERLLELSLKDTIKLLSNNYTDIIVSDKHVNLFNVSKFIDLIKECNYKKIEVIVDSYRVEEELSDLINISTKNISELLDMGIEELGHQMETIVKLKILNKSYYEKASKLDIEQ